MKSEEEWKDLGLLETYSSPNWKGDDILFLKLYVVWE